MPESQNTEWKESWSDKYFKWICGFANAQGGELVIGKNDLGEIVGIDNAKKLLEDIPNQVRDLMGILVDVDLHHHGELDYLVVHVEPYPYPISLRGSYHFRSGSTKQELKGAVLDQFLLRKYGKHWDGVPVPHVDSGDFSASAFELFRTKARQSQRLDEADIALTDAALLDKLHLFEGAYLKRAAILLFHPDAERYFTGAYIKIGYFKSNVDLMYQDEIHGDLFSQVDKTLDLLMTKYSKMAISYQGSQRIETPPIPPAALREALINAVVHKNYALATPIQISVYDDKVMIWNAGQLPENWTVETLYGKHSSIPHNPDIANAFFRAGLIESWGRGIEKIQLACSKAGTEMPTFNYEHSGMWTTFVVDQPTLNVGVEEATRKTPMKTPMKVAVKTQEKVAVKTQEEMAVKTQEEVAVKAQEEVAVKAQEEMAVKAQEEVAVKAQEEVAVKTQRRMAVKAQEEVAVKTQRGMAVKNQELILALLVQQPRLSIPDIALMIGKPRRTTERFIQKLTASGKLKRIGPAKGGHWQVTDNEQSDE